MSTTALHTAHDLEQFITAERDFELIRGKLVEMAPVGGVHFLVAGRLMKLVSNYLDVTGLGEAGEAGFHFERDPDTVLAPDLAIIRTEDIDRMPASGFVPFVPPLVAEVLSPSNRSIEISVKIEIYRGAGVEMIWIIDLPRRRAHVIDAAGREQLLVPPAHLPGGPQFPGLSVSLADLFHRLPPAGASE